MPDGQVVDLPTDGSVVNLPSVSDRARANKDPNSPGNQLSDRVIAQAGADEQRLRNKGAAYAAPIAAMAPFLAIPAGLTGLAAIAASAGAGVTGGLIANETKRYFGSSNTLHGTALLNSLGVDTALGALTGGAASVAHEATTGLLPRLVESAANKSSKGAKILDDLWYDTRDKLFRVINEADAAMKPPIVQSGEALVKSSGRPSLANALLTGEVEPQAAQAAQSVGGGTFVPVGPLLDKALSKLKNLPKGADALGEAFGGGTRRGKEILQAIEDTLVVNNGSVAMQPLGGLVRVRSDLNTAVREAALSGEEKKVFSDLANDFNDVLVKEFKKIGAEATALYNRANQLGALKDSRLAAVNVAEKTIFGMLNAHTIGAGVGAAIGFKAGGPAASAAGAYAGAMASEYVPKVAAWALQASLRNPKTAAAAKAAIELAASGKTGPAEAMMQRAFGQVGAVLKQWLTENSSDQSPVSSGLGMTQPQVAP